VCWLCIVDVIQAVQYHIKPLSQHSRIGQPTEDDLKRPLNELKLNGNFSLGEMHSWVSLCLPEIPERTTTDEITYYFKSAFLGTVLFCTYKYVISSGSYCYTFCVDIVYQIMLIYFCLCCLTGTVILSLLQMSDLKIEKERQSSNPITSQLWRKWKKWPQKRPRVGTLPSPFILVCVCVKWHISESLINIMDFTYSEVRWHE